jgi:hypothetical protein
MEGGSVATRRARLTTPRAAAVAGIVFSLLLTTSLVLIQIAVPENERATGAWVEQGGATVGLALNLVPFAGIAFLWFIGVLRDRLGAHEDQLFATVFLGSGLLFLAMLFASGAVAGGTLAVNALAPSGAIGNDVYDFGRAVTYQVMNVYAMKMAGVFMISTCALSLRTGITPRWMAVLGLALALVLIVSVRFTFLASLIFPLWVLLISVYVLIDNFRRQAPARPESVTES